MHAYQLCMKPGIFSETIVKIVHWPLEVPANHSRATKSCLYSNGHIEWYESADYHIWKGFMNDNWNALVHFVIPEIQLRYGFGVSLAGHLHDWHHYSQWQLESVGNSTDTHMPILNGTIFNSNTWPVLVLHLLSLSPFPASAVQYEPPAPSSASAAPPPVPVAPLPATVYVPTEAAGEIEDTSKCDNSRKSLSFLFLLFVAPAQPHLSPASPPVSFVCLPAAR